MSEFVVKEVKNKYHIKKVYLFDSNAALCVALLYFANFQDGVARRHLNAVI